MLTATDDTGRTYTYAYDADGNMTYGPLDGEMAHFTYDCRNRLTEVTSDIGKTIRYTYDAENNRIAVTKNTGTGAEITTEYIVDSASGDLTQILQSTEKSADGEKNTTYYYAGNRLTAQEQEERSGSTDEAGAEESVYLLYHFNNIGSTTAITTETGAIKYTYSYTPYGQLLSRSSNGISFLYNGQYGVQSDDNGLYYMRARYYNIDIKRFINQDILTGTIDSSQSLNRYAYVEGNPVSYLDPFGLEKSIYDRIHQFSKIASRMCLGLEVTIAFVITMKPETASIGIGLFCKVSEIQLTIELADMSISVIEVVDNWDEMNVDQRTDKIVELAINAYEKTALKCMSRIDDSYCVKLEQLIYSFVRAMVEEL